MRKSDKKKMTFDEFIGKKNKFGLEMVAWTDAFAEIFNLGKMDNK